MPHLHKWLISGSDLSFELQIHIASTLCTDAVADFTFLGSKITVDSDWSHEIKRCLLLGRKAMTNLDNVLQNRNITLPTKVHVVKAMVSPVVMYGYELDHKEGWAPKNWSFWIVVLEKTPQSPLDCKEIKPVKERKSTLNVPWKDWWWS